MNKKNKVILLNKVANFDWNNVLAAGAGATKKLPKSPAELVTTTITTSLDYVMAANKGMLKQKFVSDLSKLVETGKLDEGFLNNDLTRKTFTEIAEIIDKESPTQDRIDAMIALLRAVADPKETHKYETATHLNTVRQIDSVELNVLMTCYKIRKEYPSDACRVSNKQEWRLKIIETMGWDENMIYQIEMKDAHMENLRLIDGSPGKDKNNISAGANFRLTGLGIKIGDILTNNI